MKNLMYIIAILGLIAAVYGGWCLERKIHYSLSYKSMVQETVREMVKEECLKK